MVTQKRAARQRNHVRALALVMALSASSGALANTPSSDAKRRAAAAYEQGVKHFERSAYGEAARAFMEADALVPSADALTNAIVAGRKANEHLLVATAAERVLSRNSTDDERAAQAREALAEAALNLARLDLACSPEPCTLVLDGADIPAGKRFVQPGVIELIARGSGAERTDRFKLAAGANYTIVIKLDDLQASPLITSGTATDSAAPAAAPARSAASPTDSPEREPQKPLPPGVFYAGVAATVLAAGFTTWSGLRAIDAANDLPDPPSQEQYDDANGEITRTDILFALTLGLGAATAVGGVFFVDWQGAGSEQQSLLLGMRGRL
jgi:hypothetical protein